MCSTGCVWRLNQSLSVSSIPHLVSFLCEELPVDPEEFPNLQHLDEQQCPRRAPAVCRLSDTPWTRRRGPDTRTLPSWQADRRLSSHLRPPSGMKSSFTAAVVCRREELEESICDVDGTEWRDGLAGKARVWLWIINPVSSVYHHRSFTSLWRPKVPQSMCNGEGHHH